MSSSSLSVPTARRARGVAFGKLAARLGLYAVLVGGGLVFTFPFLWMVRTSLLPQEMINADPTVWIPYPAAWENYPAMWNNGPFLHWVRNSVVYTVLAVIGETCSSALVAYGFARGRFPGREKLFYLVLATLMVPFQVTLMPQFIFFNWLGWVNTLYPLIVPQFFGSAFFIFVLRQFFLSLPGELDDAAEIDGANDWTIFWRVIVPLSKPAIATVAAFAFVSHWNEFVRPLVFLQTPEALTLSVGLRWFTGRHGTEFHLLMAASVVALLPIIVVFFVAQKQFVRGIALTGLKG